MNRWKTLALAAATFGLLTGVALADDTPQQETNPPIQQKQDDQNLNQGQGADQNGVKPDDVKKDDKGNLPSDLDSDTGKGQGMGTTPDVNKKDTGKGIQDQGDLNKGAGDQGDVNKGEGVKTGGDVKGEGAKTGGDVGAGGDTGMKQDLGGAVHASKMQVKDAQQKLKDQGLYNGDIDGLIGPQTRSAIKQFQQSKGLTVNGKLDEKTLNAIGVSPAGGAQPSP
jgi:hypothetical protein